MKLPKDYYIYEPPYQTSIPSNQFYAHLFDALPSKYKMAKNYSYGVIEYLKNLGFELTVKNSSRMSRKNKTTEEFLFIDKDKRVMIEIGYDPDKNGNEYMDIVFLYDASTMNIDDYVVIKEIKEKFTKEDKRSDIKLLKNESGFIDTEDFTLTKPIVDVSLNYGEEFIKVHETIVAKLNKDATSGIVLLHGDPGTGKTTYIKYLTSLIKDKDIIFIPPSTAEVLSEPSIIPFLMDNKNSILIIEDAEKVISDRESNGSSVGVSNILNLTDGILGDCLNIQIIATFNMKKEKIDKALLRKGRLTAEWDFKPLNVKNSNELLEKTFPGKGYKTDKPMLLSDIYGFEEEDLSIKKKETIGFK